MSDVLKVDIDGLSAGSSKMAEQSTALSAAHGQSVSSVGAAQSGWVGSSAQALSSLTEHWNTLTAKHTAALDHQAAGMDTSAKMFSYMEERNAETLKAVGEQADRTT
ncbi:WXG100 family type VII secretion target [Mycobacterium sp. EPa45]|uniref:WXG100 family type VII secretion target n=1 Tax=Mycobacterium sp. EPa45 TaxID=1545728 RepID=UPI00064249D0|nr:WXG100 family type VII secretion target [Mycobacterium sp. EPa45]AKK25800.1 hypothetical protein AB431_02735 [Mycobacterium sp. EPa45]